MIYTIWCSYSFLSPNLLRDCLIVILIERTLIKIIKLFMKLSDVTAVAVVVDVAIELSSTIDRKTPIFNIAFAALNSNAKSKPKTRLFLTIFEFIVDDWDHVVDND